MSASPKDPTEAMRLKASGYPGVDEGTAWTQEEGGGEEGPVSDATLVSDRRAGVFASCGRS